MKVLANAMVVIIVQCINVSNQYLINPLKLNNALCELCLNKTFRKGVGTCTWLWTGQIIYTQNLLKLTFPQLRCLGHGYFHFDF